MGRGGKTILTLAAFATLITIGTWLGTGRHYYTKFEVVETVAAPLDEDDPLAGTGFYDDETAERTLTREEFHLGLIPTPQGLLDRHALSVLSILGPVWGLAFLILWRYKRTFRTQPTPATLSKWRNT